MYYKIDQRRSSSCKGTSFFIHLGIDNFGVVIGIRSSSHRLSKMA